MRNGHPDSIKCALSRARHGRLCFFLDFDLHRCGLFVSNREPDHKAPGRSRRERRSNFKGKHRRSFNRNEGFRYCKLRIETWRTHL